MGSYPKSYGHGGNVIYVNTKKNMVVAITSLFMPDVEDRIELIKAYIEPIFEDSLFYNKVSCL